MVIHEHPCIARCLGVGEDLFQAFKKVLLVGIVSKDFSTLDSPDDDVMEGARGIYAGASWHAARLSYPCRKGKSKFHGRPQ